MSQTLVFFDLETTGLNPYEDRIVQIGAFIDENNKYMSYIKADKPMDEKASEVTGITDDRLVGERLCAVVLKEFHTWITTHTHGGGQVVLVAHNGNTFDYKFLFVESRRHLPKLEWNVMLFDSLPYFRKTLDKNILKRTPHGQASYRLGDIYEVLFGKAPSINAHDALNDCVILRDVCHHEKCTYIPQLKPVDIQLEKKKKVTKKRKLDKNQMVFKTNVTVADDDLEMKVAKMRMEITELKKEITEMKKEITEMREEMNEKLLSVVVVNK